MFNITDINTQQIPLPKLQDLITKWKKNEEEFEIEKEDNKESSRD